MTSFRVIYALSVYLNLFVESMDVDTAFLNTTLKEDDYIDPPAGYPPQSKGLVLKFKKALYGLRQSPFIMERRFGHVLAGGAQDDSTENRAIYLRQIQRE